MAWHAPREGRAADQYLSGMPALLVLELAQESVCMRALHKGSKSVQCTLESLMARLPLTES